MKNLLEELDEAVHQKTRLALLTALSSVRYIEFVRLRELLSLTDGNLARHLDLLERMGYVRTEKLTGRKRVTRVSITRDGRAAYRKQVAVLRSLLGI